MSLVRKLNTKSTGIVRVGDEQSDELPFQKGARQGYLLSPILFNVVGEKIMRLLEEERDVYGTYGMQMMSQRYQHQRKKYK